MTMQQYGNGQSLVMGARSQGARQSADEPPHVVLVHDTFTANDGTTFLYRLHDVVNQGFGWYPQTGYTAPFMKIYDNCAVGGYSVSAAYLGVGNSNNLKVRARCRTGNYSDAWMIANPTYWESIGVGLRSTSNYSAHTHAWFVMNQASYPNGVFRFVINNSWFATSTPFPYRWNTWYDIWMTAIDNDLVGSITGPDGTVVINYSTATNNTRVWAEMVLRRDLTPFGPTYETTNGDGNRIDDFKVIKYV